jgi:hypothetical protein
VSGRDFGSLAQALAHYEAEGFKANDGADGWVTLRKGQLEAWVRLNPNKRHLSRLLHPYYGSVVELEIA